MKRIKRFFFHLKNAFKWAKIGFETDDWDWMYLIQIEKAKLESMRDYFKTADFTYTETEHYHDIVLALKCLDIIDETDSALDMEMEEANKFGKVTFHTKKDKYINTRNASRFAWDLSEPIKRYEKNESLLSIAKNEVRIEKAWNLYNKIRLERMRDWWD